MPIYEYVCLDCNHEFEELVLCGQEDVSCPKCNGRNIRKQLSVCRSKWAGGNGDSSSSSSTGGCAGCSGGNCSTCGG